jgi:hypothetical protein
MPDDLWGHCQHCKHFGSPARVPRGSEEAACNQPQLSRHGLMVFGTSGCKLFELRAGLDPRVEQQPCP